ncbi:hypothetical protein [Stenotrophomonas sp. 24(2023)]|uniref:hypothetical protein n=1 Tax=Stenotrophomonas sp. 24(2023) TaxID=3068324 RepID=UPI0027DF0F9C|nr:hypothetical protein [Stenotrophomonas sp. 24(2023)]WMJ68916.1 hypothetical protein Q9R17_17305 [Stenotrophomonas sp. 24(2023)]
MHSNAKHEEMRSLLIGLAGTQLLAVVFGLVYFAFLTYRHHLDALDIGLRVWGYLAVVFLLLHVFLAVKQWRGST